MYCDEYFCCTYVVPNKKPIIYDRLKLYPGWELNPHDHCWSQDFKSCVSTSSTTRVNTFLKIKKKSRHCRELMSGRPGSNRPPRPWQGRALPNELLPQMLRTKKMDCKSNNYRHVRKIYLYCGLYKVLPGTSTFGLPVYLCLYIV